jgi:hypothetical protein
LITDEMRLFLGKSGADFAQRVTLQGLAVGLTQSGNTRKAAGNDTSFLEAEIAVSFWWRGAANPFHMRKFFLSWPVGKISQTVSVKSAEESTESLPDQISQTASVKIRG